MGLDLHTHLFVGIKADVQHASKTEEVTRYHEETGKPYKKTIKKNIVTFGESVFNDFDELEEHIEKAGLQIENDCCEREVGNYYVGLELSESDGSSNIEADVAKVTSTLEKVKNGYLKLGIEENPKIIAYIYASY